MGAFSLGSQPAASSPIPPAFPAGLSGECLASERDPAGISYTFHLPDGDAGTETSINFIRKVVWEGRREPMLRAQVAQIQREVGPYDDYALAQGIFNWVLANIVFMNHAVGSQMVQSAKWTLTNGVGNCTDINAVLLSTMLMAAGIPVRLVTVANNPAEPDVFAHVYCEARIGGEWIPVDAARPGATFGTTVSRFARKRIWELVDSSYQDVPVPGLNGAATLGALGTVFDWYGTGTFDDVTGQYTDYGPNNPAPVMATPPPTYNAQGGYNLSTVSSILNSISSGFAAGVRAFTGPPVLHTAAPGVPGDTGIVPAPVSSSSLLLLGLLGLGIFAIAKK